MGTRRQRHKEDKLARLRAAASALFRERGFDTTTIRDVASRADLAVGTVYSYVKDKHGLLELISRDDLARTEERAFDALPNGSLRAQVLHVFGAVYAHHAEDVSLARVIVKELAFAQDSTQHDRRARFFVFIGRIAQLIADAQQRAELTSAVEPMALATQLFGLHFFVLILWLKGDLPEPNAAFAAALDLQLHGLALNEPGPKQGTP